MEIGFENIKILGGDTKTNRPERIKSGRFWPKMHVKCLKNACKIPQNVALFAQKAGQNV